MVHEIAKIAFFYISVCWSHGLDLHDILVCNKVVIDLILLRLVVPMREDSEDHNAFIAFDISIDQACFKVTLWDSDHFSL
jgi:hypothetical protein